MIEYFLLDKYLNKNIENYSNNTNNDNNKKYSNYFINFIFIIISCVAVYLSWTCQDNLKNNLGIRLIYAFFAFWFGIFYLIFYLFIRNSCITEQVIETVTETSK